MAASFLIVDAHQDIASNMLNLGRDYTRTIQETRRLEHNQEISKHYDDTLLGWDGYQKGRVAVVFATLFALPLRLKEIEWETYVYQNPLEANRIYRDQASLYHRLVEEHGDKFALLRTRSDLSSHMAAWQNEEVENPVGLILLMEGAEGVREVSELEEWWQMGVRLIGPAWAGNQYCGGTNEPGPLTNEGNELLDGMAELGFVLDLSHMDEPAALQALDNYPGRIIATHANAAALLKGENSNRHLSDRVIHGIIEREGIIGVIPFTKFLVPGWEKGDERALGQLEHVISQIDYVCQIAGSAGHSGIGSDFDGGFGLQSVPEGIDSIADLQKLAGLLSQKGYSQADIKAIFGGNWLRMLEEALPEIE